MTNFSYSTWHKKKKTIQNLTKQLKQKKNIFYQHKITSTHNFQFIPSTKKQNNKKFVNVMGWNRAQTEQLPNQRWSKISKKNQSKTCTHNKTTIRYNIAMLFEPQNNYSSQCSESTIFILSFSPKYTNHQII